MKIKDIIDLESRSKKTKDRKTHFYLEDEYDENYNIRFLHKLILSKLEKDKSRIINILNSEIKIYTNEIKSPQSFSRRKISKNKLEIFQTEKIKYETNFHIKDYIKKSEIYISEYDKYEGDIKNVVFGEESDNESINIKNNETLRKLKLVENYLILAKNYLTLDFKRKELENDNYCIGCGNDLKNNFDIIEEGVVTCRNCLAEYPYFSLNIITKDENNKTNNSNNNDSIENFIKSLNRFQGINTEITKNELEIIFEKLDKYFSMRNKISRNEVKKMDLTSKGKKGSTNNKMLRKALSCIGCSQYYEDVNYIGHCYWDWELPDLSIYQEKILSNCRKTQKVFHRIPIKKRERFSSLGTQYRLWRELQLVCDDFTPDDFRISDNPKSSFIQDDIWKMMCEGADDDEIYFIE